MGFNVFDGLATECNNEMQNAMRGWMLGSYVDDEISSLP
jgi:hypothetical protein